MREIAKHAPIDVKKVYTYPKRKTVAQAKGRRWYSHALPASDFYRALHDFENRAAVESAASSVYAGRVPVRIALSKAQIEQDIAGQNLAGKPCAIAKIVRGKIYVKWHVFHAGNRN